VHACLRWSLRWLPAHLCTTDREWINYNNLLEITRLDRFYAAPAAQRNKVRVLGTMKPNNKAIPPSSVVFTVVHGAEQKRIPLNADGSFDPAPLPGWIKDNPKVLTSMPACAKAGFLFSFVPVLPSGLQFDYAALMASVGQGNALLKSQAGIMRIMLPTFVGLELRFAKLHQATVQIATREGVMKLSANAGGVLRLPLALGLMNANARVTLSERPLSADFIVEE
jgi:hypothetical protein